MWLGRLNYNLHFATKHIRPTNKSPASVNVISQGFFQHRASSFYIVKEFKVSPTMAQKLKALFPDGEASLEYNTACEILRYISKKSYRINGTDTSYVEFGIRLTRIKFSSRANKVIQLLKNEGILECYGTRTSPESYVPMYHTDNKTKVRTKERDYGVCKKYRLNSSYSLYNYIYNLYKSTSKSYSSPLLCTEGETIRYNAVYKRGTKKQWSKSDLKMYQDFMDTLNEIDIDYAELLKITEKEVKNTNMSSFKYNNRIKTEKFEVTFLTSGTKKWMTRKGAQDIADFNHETLIQDKKNFYIGGREQFIEYKKRNMLNSYIDAIERLREGDVYAKRNGTNGRLDTNFTNLPTFLMKEIMRQNDLVSIDLANSQFAILAHKMEKQGIDSEDFTRFKDAAYNGTLYDDATQLLGYNERIDTKTGFFETIFSKSTTKSKSKDKLLSVYPTVMQYIDDVKNAGKYTDLSIGLQSEEAVIFIDGAYPLLKKQLSFVTPKHDSFIVRRAEAEQALKIVQEYFDEIGFKGKMVIEG